MTDEEYQQAQEEARLIAEYNSLVNRYNQLVVYQNQLVEELQISQQEAIKSINYTVSLHKAFMPVLDVTEAKVEEVKKATSEVLNSIIDIEKKYSTIKNISTASKKLTECDDQYERKFRLYNKFRKVCLGYVIGVDNNIISNEGLRVTLEKNYLANSDYWVAHCIMATMLWVNDEKEASDRALKQALEIDSMKSIIFFLLVNLRFGRTEAAKLWFRNYIERVDVNDIGEEWQYLLQAYLYHSFGRDEQFEKEIDDQFKKMLDEVKKFTANYETRILKAVSQFAENYAHHTDREYELLKAYCLNYDKLEKQMTMAEKNIEIAKYYNQILETDSTLAGKLSRRIEDVLYNLVNAYDEEEFELIKKIRFNEYVIKAKGDLQSANAMYNNQYGKSKKQNLSDMIFNFAFADIKENIDNQVRKFSISFLLNQIEKGYLVYHENYNKSYLKTLDFNIDGCSFSGNESTIDESRDTINKFYKKNKAKFMRRDKKFKTFTVFHFIGLFITALAALLIIVNSKEEAPKETLNTVLYISLVVGMLLTIGFALGLFLRSRKLAVDINKQREDSLRKLTKVTEELKTWRDDYSQTDDQYKFLQETLEKFRK